MNLWNAITIGFKEIWAHKQMRIHHSNVLRIGNYLYGTSGDFGPAFFTAVDARTGQILWRDRTFSRANCIYIGGKVILLDEDGVLALVTLSPQGLQVHSKFELMENKAWTPPSLVGTKLYVRDRKSMVALDLENRHPASQTVGRTVFTEAKVPCRLRKPS